MEELKKVFFFFKKKQTKEIVIMISRIVFKGEEKIEKLAERKLEAREVFARN